MTKSGYTRWGVRALAAVGFLVVGFIGVALQSNFILFGALAIFFVVTALAYLLPK